MEELTGIVEKIEGVAEATPATGVARAAAILSAGNILSRMLGLARELVIADLFGATGLVSALRIATIVPTMIYDLLVGGMISAALVPVLSEYSSAERRDELARIVSILLTMAGIALALAVLLLEVFASQLVWALGSGYSAELQAQAVGLVRIVLPATLFISLAGILTATLYAYKRFTYPALTPALYNLAIVVSALALARWLGIAGVAVGVVVGGAAQLLVQWPGLRGLPLRFALNWRHPALRRILILYAPVVAGLVVSNLQIVLDRNLASHTGEQSVAWMQNATTLIQLPIGLVVQAVSLAILPTLAQERKDFGDTLSLGIKWVLLIMLPAALGMWLLAQPLVAFLFEHGAFTSADTASTALALRFYLFGLPFVAIDSPLIFAFYARKDTVTPAVIGVVGVGAYLVTALALIGSLGMVGLVVANSVQWAGHALLMTWLYQQRYGDLLNRRLFGPIGKIAAASLLMAAAASGALALTGTGANTLPGKLVQVASPVAAALAAYVAGLWLLRVREAGDLLGLVGRRMGRKH